MFQYVKLEFSQVNRLKAIRKFFTVAAGFSLLIIGLILAIPGVPGPGIAIMIVGLIMLGEHYHWARRMVDWLKKRADSVRDRVRKRSGS